MTQNEKNHQFALIALPAIMLLLIGWGISGCGSTKVIDISNDVDHFKDRTVSLKGEVTETLALPFVHRGAYQLDDGTGKIWVVPSGDVPERGKRLRVTGTIRSGFEIAGRRLGLVLLESDETEK